MVHDTQFAVFPGLLLGRKPVCSLDGGIKDMGAYRSYARHLHELFALGILFAQPNHLSVCRFLGRNGLIQHRIRVRYHGATRLIRQLIQIMLAMLCIKDALAGYSDESRPLFGVLSEFQVDGNRDIGRSVSASTQWQTCASRPRYTRCRSAPPSDMA